MVLTLLGLPLLLLAGTNPTDLKKEEHTSSTACQVLQAAYTAATLAPATNLPRLLIYPSNIVAGWHSQSPMMSWAKDYVARLKISADEFNRLSEAQPDLVGHKYKPNCKWQGYERNHIEGGEVYTVSFTEPVISKKNDIAAVEVSFYSPGRFAYGQTCIVRRNKGWWRAQCYPGWIT